MPELTKPATPASPGISANSSAPSAESVFLSPRVIDQSAFEEYSSRLRQMMDKLQSETAALRAAAHEGNAALAELKESGKRGKEQAELAGKLLRAVNQRASELEESMNKAADHARVAARFEAEADRVVASAVGAFQKKLDAKLDEFVGELQRRAAASGVSAMARLSELEAATQRADRVLGDEASGTGLAGLSHRVLSSFAEARETEERLAAARQEADLASARLTTTLEGSLALVDQVAARQSALDQALREGIRACSVTERSLSERLAEARDVAGEAGAIGDRLNICAADARRVVDQAETLTRRAGTTLGELRDIARQVSDASAKLEPWRKVLLEDCGPDELPESIAHLVDQARHEIGNDLAKMASAMNLIARGAQTTVRAPRGGHGSPEVVIKLDQQSMDAIKSA